MKALLLIICALSVLLTSCKRVDSTTGNEFFDMLLMNTFEFYSQSTINHEHLTHKKEILELRRLAEKALEKSSKSVECEYYLNFTSHAINIISKYESNISRNQILEFQNNLRGSINERIRLLEYIALNAAIKDLHSLFYTYDQFEIFVVPDKPKVSKGEYYRAKVLMAVNDFYNPTGLIIDSDTIFGRKGVAIDYEYLVTKSGLNQMEATFLVNIRGEIIKLPILIEFYAD